jgi:ribosome maturation factor RimP
VESKRPKKIGKGKETVKTLEIPYGDIKEAIVTVTF